MGPIKENKRENHLTKTYQIKTYNRHKEYYKSQGLIYGSDSDCKIDLES